MLIRNLFAVLMAPGRAIFSRWSRIWLRYRAGPHRISNARWTASRSIDLKRCILGLSPRLRAAAYARPPRRTHRSIRHDGCSKAMDARLGKARGHSGGSPYQAVRCRHSHLRPIGEETASQQLATGFYPRDMRLRPRILGSRCGNDDCGVWLDQRPQGKRRYPEPVLASTIRSFARRQAGQSEGDRQGNRARRDARHPVAGPRPQGTRASSCASTKSKNSPSSAPGNDRTRRCRLSAEYVDHAGGEGGFGICACTLPPHPRCSKARITFPAMTRSLRAFRRSERR